MADVSKRAKALPSWTSLSNVQDESEINNHFYSAIESLHDQHQEWRSFIRTFAAKYDSQCQISFSLYKKDERIINDAIVRSTVAMLVSEKIVLNNDESDVFTRLEQRIRNVKDANIAASADHVDWIWSRLDECSGLAEARLRRMLPFVGKPNLSAPPVWLSTSIAALKDGSVLPGAIESTELLIRSLLTEINIEPPRIDSGPLGTVEVHFVSDAALIWRVSASVLPWPGVNVRSYSEPEAGSGKLDARTYHFGPALLSHAVAHLNGISK